MFLSPLFFRSLSLSPLSLCSACSERASSGPRKCFPSTRQVLGSDQDWRLLSLSAELLASLLARSPLFPPSGRLLFSPALLILFDDDDDDDHTKDSPALRFFVAAVD